MSRIGLLTPMANWAVEAEMRRLLVADYAVARLTSASPDPMRRLVDYAEKLGDAIGQFGGMPLAAVGFACTGSSYLIGAPREAHLAAHAPVPLIFAAAAIRLHFEGLGAQRIAVISPYPPALHDAGLAYWRAAGFDVVHSARVDIGSADTRRIYALDGSEAGPLIEAARARAPDAILLSGTGMPTLAHLDPLGPVPVVSSNYCLAQALDVAAREGAP
jgi:maleate isomerase